MKKILNIAILISLVVAISLVLKLPTPIMIFGIWFVINIVISIEKNKAKNKKSQTNRDPRSIPTKEIDDNEVFRNLREQTSSRNIEDTIDDNIVIEVSDKNEEDLLVNYNNTYSNDKNNLEEQTLYEDRPNSIGNRVASIRETNTEVEVLDTGSQKSLFLSTLSVEQAIIYDAMLNPKKLNYRFVKKV